MDDLGFVEAVDRLGQSIVVGIADAADGRLDAGLRQAVGVFDRDVLGRFKWSSQRYLMRGYDDQMEAAIGSFRQGFFALARSTTSGGA